LAQWNHAIAGLLWTEDKRNRPLASRGNLGPSQILGRPTKDQG
jgi:hypothetical protein